MVEDLLNDEDPNNDQQAAQLLAANPNLGLQIDGVNFFGTDAAGLLVSQNGYIDIGLIGTVTVSAGGLNASWDFQPFALYDDGYGNTYNVLLDPNSGTYIPFDQNNQTDRQRAAESYAQKAAAERAAGRTQQAEYFEKLSRVFQILTKLARLSDEKDQSLDLLVEARDVAEEIDSAELKVFALMAIAAVYEERTEREHSLETLNRAFEACDDFENANLVGLPANFAKDEALLEILEAFLRFQDLSKASEVADAVEDRFLFARANLKLAIARGKNQPSEAAEYLDEAIVAEVGKDAGGVALPPFGKMLPVRTMGPL